VIRRTVYYATWEEEGYQSSRIEASPPLPAAFLVTDARRNARATQHRLVPKHRLDLGLRINDNSTRQAEREQEAALGNGMAEQNYFDQGGATSPRWTLPASFAGCCG